MNTDLDSLFQFDAGQWRTAPSVVFDAFLSGYRFNQRGLRPSSFAIYRGMFQRLVDWASGQGIYLLDIQVPAIERFLDGRRLGPESRHRYLLLFTSLFEHLALLTSTASVDELPESENPARTLLLQDRAPERQDPDFMTSKEVQRFIEALPGGANWKRVRDRAIAMMLLGAGLRSGEALTLQMSDLLFKDGMPHGVWVQAHKPRPARQVPLQPFAIPVIADWLKLRAKYASGEVPPLRNREQRLAGTLVFPSGLPGGPLQPVTLFRLVKATLDAAQISKRYEGPTLLRNSCGALWLQQSEPHQVRLWLGHETLRSTEQLISGKRGNASKAVYRRRKNAGAYE